MSFHLAETPTLEAIAIDDEQLLAQDLKVRVEEGIQQAETQPEVAEAADAEQDARNRLDRLRAAERALSRQAKESRERMAELSAKTLETLVEAAASGKKLEFKKLDEMAAGEAQIRALGQAIERLTEHLIPLAQMGSLREEAHALEARARALDRIAQERAEKVLQQLRGAVTEEVVLPVDMSKGVAGALLARAAGLKRCAVQISENADKMQRAYQDRKDPFMRDAR